MELYRIGDRWASDRGQTGRYGMMSRMAKSSGRRTRDPWNIGMIVVGVAALVFAGYAAVSAATRDTHSDYVSSYVAPDSAEALKVPLTITRPADRPLNALFIGDSIMNATGATETSFGFRSRLLDYFRESGPAEQSVSAIGGAKLRLVADSTQIPDNIDVAIVELGTNDPNDPATPVNDFRTQYRGLLDRIRAAAPDAPLLCLGLWRDGNGGVGYNNTISDACKRANGRYIPMTDLFDNTALRGPAGLPAIGTDNLSDNFHPNNDGFGAIYERIRENIAVA